MQVQESNIILYESNDGSLQVDVHLEDETVRLNQDRMAELFGVQRPAIMKHLQNIFDEGELDEHSTCSILEQVQREGNREVKKEVKFYNLDAIILDTD